jgi:hypothetical protein
VRKIKSNFFISLDGVVESPDKWHFPYFDDEMGAAVGAGFSSADALLIGRVLYNEWAAYWPEHANEPFGDVMNSIKKYVGGDIAMPGSATTVRWLLREGLLDRASSTCSCTRSLSATAWLGSFRRTSQASPWSY